MDRQHAWEIRVQGVAGRGAAHQGDLRLERGLPSRAKVAVFRCSAWMLDVWYSKIWRRRIAPRLGLKPGEFLGLWVRSHMLAK